MKKAKMKIDGMDCASCAVKINKSLTSIGAKEINVNAIFGKATADVEDDVTEEQLKKAVADPGYELKEVEFE
jgi:copper chaperone